MQHQFALVNLHRARMAPLSMTEAVRPAHGKEGEKRSKVCQTRLMKHGFRKFSRSTRAH
jgi:hypothetical protein